MKNFLNRLFFVISMVYLVTGLSVHADPVVVPAPPQVNASSYLLVDFYSGKVLVSHNIDEKLPPASLTKIMTTYVAASELEAGHIRVDDTTVVSEKAWKMGGSKMFIEVNKKVTVDELLHGIVIQSGNDASVALAEYISGDESVFAQLMNQHAKKLGLTNSHFENASGLPGENHYTTAHDLSILAAALIRNYPEIYKIHSIRDYTYNGIKQNNRNRLLWLDESVDGIKTGHTEDAGFCLVTSAERDGMRLIAVVMGAESEQARVTANQALLTYGFRFYETRKVFGSEEVLVTGTVWKGKQDKVNIGINRDLYVTIARGQFDNLESRFDLRDPIIAPVQQGTELGNLTLSLAGTEVVNMPVFSSQDVAEAGFFKRMKDGIRLFLR